MIILISVISAWDLRTIFFTRGREVLVSKRMSKEPSLTETPNPAAASLPFRCDLRGERNDVVYLRTNAIDWVRRLRLDKSRNAMDILETIQTLGPTLGTSRPLPRPNRPPLVHVQSQEDSVQLCGRLYFRGNRQLCYTAERSLQQILKRAEVNSQHSLEMFRLACRLRW